MSRRSSPRSIPRRSAHHWRSKSSASTTRDLLRRARASHPSLAAVHARPAARVLSPRHRELATPDRRRALPSDIVGVAAVFGVSLGAVLISIILGLVGPSRFVAVTMLGSGMALALFIVARKQALYSTTLTTPPFAHPEMR